MKMNVKQRKEYWKNTLKIGDKIVVFRDTKNATVTRVTPHNCYLDGVRHSWTTIEECWHQRRFGIPEGARYRYHQFHEVLKVS